MNPTQLAECLAKTIKAKLPVLIKGAPGIGKTDIVTQAARQAEADLIIAHPVVSDPTDFKGLPGIVNDKAVFLPFGELQRLIIAKKPTVYFLDDLGQAPAMVQAAAMQLILARQINGHMISDHVVFIAATNRREDKAGVTSILEPVKSRFATIVSLEVSIDDWAAWALDNDVPPELVAFVRFRPELMLSPEPPTNDIVNRPCPRTVTNAGKLLNAGINDMETLAGAVGQGFAAEFVAFMRIWQSLPSLDGILLSPDTAQVPTEHTALFAIATAIATRVTKDNASRIMKYAVRLPEEYATLAIRDCIRKCEAVQNTKEFIKWVTTHQDIFK